MKNLDHLITLAVKEDIGCGDVTATGIIGKEAWSAAEIRAKEEMVLAGIDVAAKVFKKVDRKIKIRIKIKDGRKIKKGVVIARLQGPTRSLLAAERTALNFLQHLSGIAGATRKYVDAIRGTGTKMLDTRKTIPGLRALEKYAVRVGGGINHRMGLNDMYLVKNNHITAAGSVTEAILRVKKHGKKGLKIEVEVSNFRELCDAVVTGADIIMFDNFTVSAVKKAVRMVGALCRKFNISPRPKTEVSGNITLKNIREYAMRGVDFISVGSITHSAPAADINMIFPK